MDNASHPSSVGTGDAPHAQQAEPSRRNAPIILSLPTVHCQGCISAVERELAAMPGVNAARVNLTLKRATVEASPEIQPEDLAKRLGDIGFEAHELDAAALQATGTDAVGRNLLICLAIAGFAAMNVMLLSVSVWSGAQGATRDMFHWISAVIAFPAVAFAARPFFRNAWSALSSGRLNMDVPITLAILLALATSLWETMLSGAHAYFDAALMLTFFLLVGRYLEHRTRVAARSAAAELAALEVSRARVLVDGKEFDRPLAEVSAGELIRVVPGGRVPVDGVIVAGESEIDRSLLTGETVPDPVASGQEVCAGEVNLTGSLKIRVTAVGSDSSLARLADLVAVAESGRSNYAPLADSAARLYAPGVHVLAVLAFLGWWLWSGDLRIALNIAAAVLIITCPCALALAVPAVTVAASGRLFRKGLLVKHATALERLAQVDTVVFDKTGTLTGGIPELQNVPSHSPEVMSVALALAEGSAHPFAMSLARAARKRGVIPSDITGLREVPGCGIEASWHGQRVRLGRGAWVGHNAEEGGASVWLSSRDGGAHVFRFIDSPSPGAADVVSELTAAGMDVRVVSGDSGKAVANLARRLGISVWVAGALPGEKAQYVKDLAAEGRHVLMVGDGLNDTAALAGAHVSISPASALEAARAASDIVLLGRNLASISFACKLARTATRRVRENLRIATIYNIVAVPLAVAGLATPLVAALAMSASSITVSLNAMRLR